jgi:hypothetical protein
MQHLLEPKDPRLATKIEYVTCVIAYLRLLGARCEAKHHPRKARADAVPMHDFPERGIDDEVLLWMMYQGHVEPLPQPGALDDVRRRPWHGTDAMIVRESSRFLLTDVGAVFADNFLAASFDPEKDQIDEAWQLLRLGQLVPFYNREERILRWGPLALKHFLQPAGNQELVLCSALELGWPAWFDDPLSPVAGCNPKRRLHDTIKALNRYQSPYLVHFKGDGTGRRIGWELRWRATPELPHAPH